MSAQLALLGGTPVCDDAIWPRWPIWDAAEAEALRSVLESGQWQAGPQVQAFERAFAAYQSSARSLCVTNGTAALEIALRALGVGADDEVIVPNYTFAATALAVLSVGGTPVFVDSEPERLNLDPAAVTAAVGPRTVGIVPVHLGGHPADLDALLQIAQRHGLFVLEDAAQAHGAEWRGERVGALGDLGTFSFQTGKSMTSGDGGSIVTNDGALADACHAVRDFGREPGGPMTSVGGNYRMTEFQAAVLQCQLARLDPQIERRQGNLAGLSQRLGGLSGIRPAEPDVRATRLPHYLTLLHYEPGAFAGVPKRTFLAAMQAEGIPLEPGYAPLTRFPVFGRAVADGRARRADTPVADAAADEGVLWLTFRALTATPAKIGFIADAAEKVYGARDELARWDGAKARAAGAAGAAGASS